MSGEDFAFFAWYRLRWVHYGIEPAQWVNHTMLAVWRLGPR